MRTVRSAGGRRRYDAFTSSFVDWLPIDKARGMPGPETGSYSLGQLPSIISERLREIRRDGTVEFYERVDLKAWTGLGVGGYGDVLIRCSTPSSVHEVLNLLASHGLRWFVIGAGSRVIAPDRGFRVPLLNLTGELGLWEVKEEGIEAGAGAKLAQVCTAVARAGLAGLENLAHAPGSVGGVIRSAANRQPGWFHELVEWVETVTPGLGVARHRVSGAGGEGWSRLANHRVVVSKARFRTTQESARPLPFGQRAGRRTSERFRARASSPVFLDPPDGRAVVLLENTGCGGLRMGGARVAEWSANAIIATRDCSSSDIASLVRRMRDMVREQCGVDLEPRLWFVDENGQRIDP